MLNDMLRLLSSGEFWIDLVGTVGDLAAGRTGAREMTATEIALLTARCVANTAPFLYRTSLH